MNEIARRLSGDPLSRSINAMPRLSNYTRSNRITKTEVTATEETRSITKQLLATSDTDERQSLSSALIYYLNLVADLPEAKVKISATRQYHAKRAGRIVFKRYGYYKQGTRYIYIQNFTPARGQALAPKTFLDTLLHEWLHHYDTFKLKLHSIHTAGFYSRLRDLKERLDIT